MSIYKTTCLKKPLYLDFQCAFFIFVFEGVDFSCAFEIGAGMDYLT